MTGPELKLVALDPDHGGALERLIGCAHAVMSDLELMLCPPAAGRPPFMLGKEHTARA